MSHSVLLRAARASPTQNCFYYAPVSLFPHHRNAYNLVLHKHGELLYNGVRKSVQTHLAAVAARVALCPDEQLLQELSARWGDHQVTMVMIRDILMYMDR